MTDITDQAPVTDDDRLSHEWADAVREGVNLALSRMTPEELYEMATDSYRQIREEKKEG